ncbi:MAG: hypothetical protein ACFE95_13500 [Candidatus Hodarchaeota archaeon]
MEAIKLTLGQKMEDLKLGSTRYIYEILKDLSDRITELEGNRKSEKISDSPLPKVGKK